MKALSVVLDNNMTWDAQAATSFSKGNKLVSVFKHIRKYMYRLRIKSRLGAMALS
jgi:hypothetical protein